MSEYKFNQEISTINNRAITIYGSVPITWDSITIKITVPENTSTENSKTYDYAMTIQDSTGNSYTTGVVSVTQKPSSAARDTTITFNLNSFKSAENSTITLSFSKRGTDVYGGTVVDGEKYLSGLGAYVTSSNIWYCTISASSSTIWETGTDGYPSIVDNKFYVFKDWARDEYGYPLNCSVWKIAEIQKDGQNDGYPWIIGFTQWNGTFSDIYIKTETGLIQCNAYIKTEMGLQPVHIIIKEE